MWLIRSNVHSLQFTRVVPESRPRYEPKKLPPKSDSFWAMRGRTKMASPGQKRSVSYNKLYPVGIRFLRVSDFSTEIYIVIINVN